MSQVTYTVSPDGRSIKCHFCGRTSSHPKDVEHHYCGACHIFHDDAASVRHHRAQLSQVMVEKPSDQLFIDLADLEDKWSVRGRRVCAVCGFDFDQEDECLKRSRRERRGRQPGHDLDEGQVPLLLWRNEGREMLTLCWECATVRMQRKEGN